MHAAPPGPLRLDVELGTADLWAIPLPAGSAANRPAGVLCSPEERARAARILAEGSRFRFLLVRSSVRDILSRYLPGRRPEDLLLSCGPHGKPRLEDPGIEFNVSHCRTAAMCCVARVEVGIDLERVRPIRDSLWIARRFFTGEDVEAIRSRPAAERLGAFFRVWTRKEACAKALGLGFALPLSSFVAGTGGDGDEERAQALRVGGRSVWLRSLPSGRGWAAALASSGRGVDRLRTWSYTPSHEPLELSRRSR